MLDFFSTGKLGYQARRVDMAEWFEKENFVKNIFLNIVEEEGVNEVPRPENI